MNEIILLADINECKVEGWRKNTGEVNARMLKVVMCDKLKSCAEQLVTFELEDGTLYESKVINDVAEIPIIDKPQRVKIGLYTLDFEGDKLFKRYSSKPDYVYVNMGSYNDRASNPPIPTPGTYADLKKYVDEKISDFKISPITEITEESTDEEIPSALAVKKLTAKKLTDFKEKEIDYTTIYSYDTEDLKSRKAKNTDKPIYEVELYKDEEAAEYDYFIAGVNFNLHVAYKNTDAENNASYYVETPLKVVFDDPNKTKFENVSNLYDVGLVVDGKAYPLSKYLSELVDETGVFYYTKIKFGSIISNNSTIALRCNITIASLNESAIDTLLTETQGLLSLYGDTFLLYYKNAPVTETIQAQYIGG